jgi:hypothetical protein
MVRWSGEVVLFFSWSGKGSGEKGIDKERSGK